MKAYIFPGQGAQVVGMGKELCKHSSAAKEYLETADAVLGFDLSRLMDDGTEEELRQTKVTQPVIFLYSVIKARTSRDFKPDMVAGHSLGEFSALVSARALSFADGLRLVYQRALAMQAACEQTPSTMAAVLGADEVLLEKVCADISRETGELVVPANYNCPGQLVISGSVEGIRIAETRLKEYAFARRVMVINVGGAFHSPFMQPAQDALESAIRNTPFRSPSCPVYQNVDAMPRQDADIIKENLIAQLTAPVRWTETIEYMIADGATQFIEVGPKQILTPMVKKISDKASALMLQ